MPLPKSPSRDRSGVEKLAAGWGKIVARRLPEDRGPDLDLDADDIEHLAATAARAVARGAIEDLLERKASLRGPEQPCPTGQRPCPGRREPRPMDFWGGAVTAAEPVCHCPACRRDFFPAAPHLAAAPSERQPLGARPDRPQRRP